ncbi:MAG: PH domain-containing protein [Bradymonadales bacterium]|nr:PH domain-containing protein [Bradymonadales bacterium]
MEENVLLRRHPSIRNHLSLIVWPVLAIPVLIYLLHVYVWGKWLETPMPWWVYLIVIMLLLMFPLYAWFRSLFRTYMVTSRSVFSRRGLFSRYSNEIRIRDIRGINVSQSLLQRIMNVGRVGFSSAAGDEEEVQFLGVRDPEGVKRLVQEQMAEIKDHANGE